jgi:hypothetical protein
MEVLVMSMKPVIAAVLFLYATAVPTLQSPPSGNDVYQWHGEVVSWDAAAKIATVKSRLVDERAVAEVKKFKPGDRVLLRWSGYDRYADGIRGIVSSTRSEERFLLPVELVSTETPNQYLTFRVRVPDASVGAVASLKPGEWVTATASHRPASENAAIVSMRPYVTAPAASTE